MRPASVLLAVVGSLLASVDTSHAAEPARQHFRGNCLGCHSPPDLQFTTDRAWLDQVRRTA